MNFIDFIRRSSMNRIYVKSPSSQLLHDATLPIDPSFLLEERYRKAPLLTASQGPPADATVGETKVDLSVVSKGCKIAK